MTTQEQLAQFVEDLKDLGWSSEHEVTPDGIVFTEERSARLFAKRYGKDIAVHASGRLMAKDRVPAHA